MYYKINEMDYWYEIHGEGIPVVCLHGFTGSSSTWDSLISSKTEGIQWITVDLPGHGRTKGDILKTMDDCIHDLHLLFQNLNLSPFILIGYSMGGRTALSYMVEYPNDVKALLLESASPGLKDTKEREQRKKNDEKLATMIEEKGVQSFVDYWENIPLFDTQKRLPTDGQQTIRNERLMHQPEGLANSLRGMGTGSQRSNWQELADLNLPVYLLVGELDEKFIRINKEMKAQLKDATLQVIPEVGHAIHIEKPNAFEQIVVEVAKYYTS